MTHDPWDMWRRLSPTDVGRMRGWGRVSYAGRDTSAICLIFAGTERCLAWQLTPSVMIGASPLDRREHLADPSYGSDFLGMRNASCICRNPQIEKEGVKIMSAAASTVSARP
jgi:hypothetical protein